MPTAEAPETDGVCVHVSVQSALELKMRSTVQRSQRIADNGIHYKTQRYPRQLKHLIHMHKRSWGRDDVNRANVRAITHDSEAVGARSRALYPPHFVPWRLARCRVAPRALVKQNGWCNPPRNFPSLVWSWFQETTPPSVRWRFSSKRA